MPTFKANSPSINFNSNSPTRITTAHDPEKEFSKLSSDALHRVVRVHIRKREGKLRNLLCNLLPRRQPRNYISTSLPEKDETPS